MTRREDLLDAAKEIYGTTVVLSKAVFLLPDGELLKMNDEEDHIDMAHTIYREFDGNDHPADTDDPKGVEHHLIQDLEQFQKETGSIRFNQAYHKPSEVLLDVWSEPTPEQIETLKDYDFVTVVVKDGLPRYKTAIQRALRTA